MNLRPVRNGFPPRDEIPSKILTEDLDISCRIYEARCSAFFAAIFRLLKLELLGDNSMDTTEAISLWNRRMCEVRSDFRTGFFGRMELEYNRVG